MDFKLPFNLSKLVSTSITAKDNYTQRADNLEWFVNELARVAALPAEPEHIAPTRIEYLKLASTWFSKLTRRDVYGAFLWEYDRNERYQDFQLANFYVSGQKDKFPSTIRGVSATPSSLKKQGLAEVHKQTENLDPLSLAKWSSVADSPVVPFCTSGEGSESVCFPLSYDKQHEKNKGARLLGLLQLVIPKGAAATDWKAFSALSVSLGKYLAYTSQVRRLRAAAKISTIIRQERELGALLKKTTGLLAKETRAELVLGYRQKTNSLNVVCASIEGATKLITENATQDLNSLTYSQFLRSSGPIRLRDIQDPEERRDARLYLTKGRTNLNFENSEMAQHSQFDSKHVDSYSQLLESRIAKAWMCCPIRIDEHNYAVFKLVNKKSGISSNFSATDERILNDVCELLSVVIPKLEQKRALNEISSQLSDKTLHNHREREKLFQTLVDIIPGTTGLGLVQRADKKSLGTLRALGGKLAIPSTEENRYNLWPSSRYDSGVRPLHSMANKIPRWTWAGQVERSPPEEANLIIILNRFDLATYEVDLLRFVCAEISRLLASDDLLTNLLQLRHRIRSHVTGMSGKIAAAKGQIKRLETYSNTGHGLPSALKRGILDSHAFSLRIKTLLESSRLLVDNLSHSSLTLGEVSLNATIEEAVSTLRYEADSRGVQIDFQPHRSDIQAECDPELISMAIFNLVENAVKYSKAHKKVSITTRQNKSKFNKDQWELLFANDGDHIPKSEHKIIFQSFRRIYRDPGAHTANTPGTGLGLSLVKQIADAHLGSIKISSEEREGDHAKICFTLSIPLASP